jgi:hypothetical protein
VVRVVLLETTDTGETGESAGRFVAVENTEVGHADGELAVRAVAGGEDEAVRGAVHGLEGEGLLLDVELEHVVGVVLPVTRRLPQLRVEHVRGDDLLVVALAVFRLLERSVGTSCEKVVRERRRTRMNSMRVL